MFRRIILSAVFLRIFLCGAALAGEDINPEDLHARAAVLMDANTGYVIFEKNADEQIPPASLTKIMTLYLAYQAVAEGRFRLESPMKVSRRADFRAQERGSSVMYLEPGQKPTLLDLMTGLALASGNDAAVAVAENLHGSVKDFVKAMNQTTESWGLDQIFFADPAGISPLNKVTARQYAVVVQKYLHDFPEALRQIHGLKAFVYPRRENWPAKGRKWHHTFENRIPLLFEYEGADGLKTGYISESGYNLASTARRGDTRLLGVLLGVQAPGIHTGNARRSEDMMRLMDYGFSHYESVNVNRYLMEVLPPVRVFGGAERTIALKADRPVYITLKKGEEFISREELRKIRWFVAAPFKENEVVKKVNLNVQSVKGKENLKLKFISARSVKISNWLLWLQDYSTYLLKNCLPNMEGITRKTDKI